MINAIKKAAIIGGGVIGGGWAARFQEPSLPLRTMEPHGLLGLLEHRTILERSFSKTNFSWLLVIQEPSSLLLMEPLGILGLLEHQSFSEDSPTQTVPS